MGNLCLSALGSGRRKVEDDGQETLRRTVSPVPMRRQREAPPHSASGMLQGLCVAVVANHIAALDVSVLPVELVQLVLDALVADERLTLPLLARLQALYPDALLLGDYHGVDDQWAFVIGKCSRLRCLDLSGCTALTDTGAACLGPLWRLRSLCLSGCTGLTDAGALCALPGLTALTELRLAGCEGLTGASMQALGGMTGLRILDLEKCAGVAGGLQYLSGMSQLQELRLGWCRALCSDGHISHLAHLTALTRLQLGHTLAGAAAMQVVGRSLSRLAELDVSGCSGVRDDALTALLPLAGRLRRLQLKWCKVSDAGMAALGRLTALQALDLGYTRVRDAGVLQLRSLLQLEELSLDSCDVGDDACQVFRSLTCLQRLDLSDTSVGDIGACSLSRLGALQVLALSNTEVTDAGAGCIACLTGLLSLTLDTRGVSDGTLALLAPLAPRLQELDLFSSRISGKGVAHLVAFTALQRLEVCSGVLTDRACTELACIKSLKHLTIAQNSRVGDAGVRALASALGELQTLNLTYTGITNASLPSLARMRSLCAVSLSFTRVTEAAVAQLREHAPHLLVKFSVVGRGKGLPSFL